MKNLILLIGLFSTTLCFSADNNVDDVVPTKRQRVPSTRRVYFAESAKNHDGLRPETLLKEELIHAYFDKQSIKSKEDIAKLIADKKISLPKESLIKIIEELNDLVTQIKEKRRARVITCAFSRELTMEECHRGHLELRLIPLFSAYIDTISASE